MHQNFVCINKDCGNVFRTNLIQLHNQQPLTPSKTYSHSDCWRGSFMFLNFYLFCIHIFDHEHRTISISQYFFDAEIFFLSIRLLH